MGSDAPPPSSEAKRVGPAGSSGESAGANLPVAASVASTPVNLEEELVVGDPNDYFDDLARKRWRKKGDSTNPEPPTVVYRVPAKGCILVGGIPD